VIALPMFRFAPRSRGTLQRRASRTVLLEDHESLAWTDSTPRVHDSDEVDSGSNPLTALIAAIPSRPASGQRHPSDQPTARVENLDTRRGFQCGGRSLDLNSAATGVRVEEETARGNRIRVIDCGHLLRTVSILQITRCPILIADVGMTCLIDG
jgi:hypothetical protein